MKFQGIAGVCILLSVLGCNGNPIDGVLRAGWNVLGDQLFGRPSGVPPQASASVIRMDAQQTSSASSAKTCACQCPHAPCAQTCPCAPPAPPPPPPPPPPTPAPFHATSKTTASCVNGKFTCKGSDQAYCHQQRQLCQPPCGAPCGAAPCAANPACAPMPKPKKICNPLCHYSCTNPKCEKTCAPKCEAPICQTRCKGLNTKSCRVECPDKPDCAVVCPKKACQADGCVKCHTVCTKPTCDLVCGKDLQDCKHVCAEPFCDWECKDPEKCPEPKCTLVCAHARNCIASEIHKELPPLTCGETEITNFKAQFKKDEEPKAEGAAPAAAPAVASLLAHSTQTSKGNTQLSSKTQSTMIVTMNTMGCATRGNSSIESSEVELPVADDEVDDGPVMAAIQTWARQVATLSNGHVTESEASCEEGHFQCHGEAAWCGEQESVVCKVPTAFMQRRSRTQSQQHGLVVG